MSSLRIPVWRALARARCGVLLAPPNAETWSEDLCRARALGRGVAFGRLNLRLRMPVYGRPLPATLEQR